MSKITKNKIFVILSTVLMLAFNFYAEWLPINGVTRLDVLNSIPVYFIPSNYVYNIWYLIYAGLIIFSVCLLFCNKDISNKITTWIIVANIFNIVWVFVWHYLLTGLAVISVAIIFLSLSIVYIEAAKKDTPPILKLFFSVYTPWMMVVMLSNFAAANYIARGGEFFFSAELTAIFLIIIITMVAVLALLKREDVIFSGVVLFTLFGILTKHFNDSQSIVAISTISGFILFVGIIVTVSKRILLKDKQS